MVFRERSEERFSRNAETDLVCRLLLEKKNLERAVSSERVGNLQVLMPSMVDRDVAGWEQFFRRYTRLTARYAIEAITVHGDEAHATVRTLYTYVPAGGGAQSETRLRQAIRFIKTPDGWRVADIRDLR